MSKQPDADVALLRTVDELGRRGLYTKAIARVTGLSLSQVAYRLKRLEVKLGAYRDGASQEAQRWIEATPCAKFNVQAHVGERYRVVGIKIT